MSYYGVLVRGTLGIFNLYTKPFRFLFAIAGDMCGLTSSTR